MQRFPSVAISLSAALLVCGCVSNASFRTTAPHSPKDVLTRAEIDANGVSDPLDAVMRLRPNWLRPKVRHSTHNGIPLVYAQNMPLGTVRELTSLRIEGIQELRYIRPVDATIRWGMGHTSGVIEVIWVGQP